MRNLIICLVLIAVFAGGCSESQPSELKQSQAEKLTWDYDCERLGHNSVIRNPIENWTEIKESLESDSFDFAGNFELIRDIYQNIYEIGLYGTSDAMDRDRDKEIYSDCDEAGCRKAFCYLVNSIKNENIEICSELPDSLKINYISNHYLSDGKYPYYENISLNYRDMCFAHNLINEKLSDENFCDSLEEGWGFSTKDLCNMNLALINNEPSICLSLPESGLNYGKSGCLKRVALMWGNIEACRIIVPKYHAVQSSQIRDECYKSVAIKMNNSELCNQIESDIYKELCLLNFD